MTESNNRKAHEIEHGKKIAKNAEKIWGHDSLAGQIRVKRRIDTMITRGKIDKNSKVLELGCGTGEFTKQLAETGAEITCIDLSPDLLELAKRNLQKFNNVKFMIADMEKLEGIADNYFDVIVGNSVLHHVDYGTCFKLCLEKLKENGKIIFSEPNMMNPQIALQKNIPWLKKLVGDSPDETAFFRWELTRLLKKLKYKNIDVKNFDFLHPKMPDIAVDIVKSPLYFLEKIPLIKEITGSLLIYAEK